jgi:two-component system alkaline phosphatase synthesis response regulator PhoP
VKDRITKATAPRELTAALIIHLGDLDIDPLQRRVRIKQREIRLTARAQSLLFLLAANVGRILSRERILDAVWGVDYIADSNVVEAQIRLLRLHLGDDARSPRYIETVPGQGYRFIAPETPPR